MKTFLLLILLAPLLTFAQKKEEPPKKPVASDTVVLEITEKQDQMLIQIDTQINQLNEQRNLIYQLILDWNRKKESEVKGKQIKTIKRKE